MSVQWPHIYFLAMLAAAALLLILTPAAQKVAAKLDIMDRPSGEKHKFHGKATPLLGGAAMFSGWLIALAGGLAIWHLLGIVGNLSEINRYLAGADSVTGRIIWLATGAAAAVTSAANL